MKVQTKEYFYIVEESIFSDISDKIKDERIKAKKKKSKKRKDSEPEKQTKQQNSTHQEDFIKYNKNTGDEYKNSKNNKSAFNKNMKKPVT